MKNIKRPSKAMIVNKALDFVYDAQVSRLTRLTEYLLDRIDADTFALFDSYENVL